MDTGGNNSRRLMALAVKVQAIIGAVVLKKRAKCKSLIPPTLASFMAREARESSKIPALLVLLSLSLSLLTFGQVKENNTGAYRPSLASKRGEATTIDGVPLDKCT